MKFLYTPSPVASTVAVADPTLCCTVQPLTWLVRVHQHNTLRLVINSALNLLPGLTSTSFKRMSETCFPALTWNARFHFARCDMSPRVPEPNFRMVCFSKGTLIKMLTRSKNG